MGVYASFAGTENGMNSAAAKLKEYLEDTEFFDSVSIDGSTHVVSCAYGGATVATFEFEYNGSGYYGKLKITFGGYSNTNSFNISTDDGVIWIGKTARGVIVGVKQVSSGSLTTRCAICKSVADVPMMLLYADAGPSFIALTADHTEAPSSVTISDPTSSAYYSNLCGVCTRYAGPNAAIAAADKVYRFIERQTNVPTNSISSISINGTIFLADGFFALRDASET